MEEKAGAWYLAELRINIHQVSICLSINMEFLKSFKSYLNVFKNSVLTVYICVCAHAYTYAYICLYLHIYVYLLLGRNQQTSVLYTDSLTQKVKKDTE